MVNSIFIYLDRETGNGSFIFSGVDEQSLLEMRVMESLTKTLTEQLGRACVELEVRERVRKITEGEANEQRSSE
jgi:hypothetical protein